MLEKLHDYFNLDKYEKPCRLTTLQVLEIVYKTKPGVCKVCGGRLIIIESRGRPVSRASPKTA